MIEDVVTGGDINGQFVGEQSSWSPAGRARLTHEPGWLQAATLRILNQSDVFLADTTVGHRDLMGLHRSVPSKWFHNQVDHNTHVVVIRKKASFGQKRANYSRMVPL